MRGAILLAQALMFVLVIGCHAHDRIIGLDGGANAGAAVMSGGPSGGAGAGTEGTNVDTMPSTAHDAGTRTGSRVPEGSAGADANGPGNAGAPGSSVSADGGAPATSD